MSPNIIAQIRTLRAAMGLTGRKFKKPPIPRYPFRLEAEYTAAVLKYVDNVFEVMENEIRPILPVIGKELKQDSWADLADMALRAMNVKLSGNTFTDFKFAETFSRKASEEHAADWQKTIKKVMGINLFTAEPWLNDVLSAFARENVALIKNIKDEAEKRIHTAIFTGFTQGKRWETIAKEMFDSEGETLATVKQDAKTRARRIARDQLGKLNSNLTERRHKDLGITGYIWHNSKDKRVRGNPDGYFPNSTYNHWKREGQYFKYSAPPPDGNPAFAILCRCTAEPAFFEIETEVNKTEKRGLYVNH